MSIVKNAKYKNVYESLLNEIQSGKLLPDTQLPTEEELALKYNVSRNTLRQALLLLAKEGYIKNHQGKGTFIQNIIPEKAYSYECIQNPIINLSKVKIDDIKLESQILRADKNLQALFNIDASKLLIELKISYFSKNTLISRAECIITYDTLSKDKVPLDDNNAILDFYNYILLRKDLKVKSTISFSKEMYECTNDFFSSIKILFKIDETYRENNKTIMSQVLYLDPDNYEITVFKSF